MTRYGKQHTFYITKEAEEKLHETFKKNKGTFKSKSHIINAGIMNFCRKIESREKEAVIK